MHIYKVPQVSYERARSWQRERVNLCHAGLVNDALVMLEHPSTYTCGRATRDHGARTRLAAATPNAPACAPASQGWGREPAI